MSDKINTDFYKWNKTELVKKNIEKERNLNWYKKNYRRNLNISLCLSLLSIVLVVFSLYHIKNLSSERETFITSTSGDVIQYEMTDDKKELLEKALQRIREKRNSN